MPDSDQTAKQLKLLYISCGNKDGLIRISQGVHAYLKENHVPLIWHVDDHAHDFQHWKKALYNYPQLIFKSKTNWLRSSAKFARLQGNSCLQDAS